VAAGIAAAALPSLGSSPASTSSFYERQGFMEGAALSGQRAAAEAYRLALWFHRGV